MSRRCVLAADPELGLSTPAHAELAASGYEVLGVTDTGDLLDLLRQGHGDVLVFNADQLARDELPFLQYLQTQRPTLRTIATSANESLQWEAAVRRQSIFYFLPKPIDLGELRLVLADAFQTRGRSAPMEYLTDMSDTDSHRQSLARVMDHLAATVPAALGPACRSVYLTGSAALGQLHPTVQDVDLLFIVDEPLDKKALGSLRDCLNATRTVHEDENTRIVWHVMAGPWKPEPDPDRWTIALHGNLMTRAQLGKFSRHLANIATTMFDTGRTLAGEDPARLAPPAPVTARLQRENVFGLRWLRDLLYSVTACTLDAPPLQPVLTNVVQYASLAGARNLRLITGDEPPPTVAATLDRIRRLKEAGVHETPHDLVYDAALALAEMQAALPEVSHA